MVNPAVVLLAMLPLQSPPTHWAFVPLREVTPPTVRSSAEVRTPIDAFLRPTAPPTDKRTLIRRATFDLTGLPPTPEEIAAFLNDASPHAFATVVERLLASPAYGERWGRHWLDVARYADSNGMDENLVQASAWRYRDYVIRSLNADKPFDLFAREQIAGDLMPDGDPRVTNDRIMATGFLALGPKMLAEDDPVKMEMDIIDEQVDAVGKAFLGMTLGCARCHDHKFDPISTADYYGLAGIFKSTKTMNNFKVVAQWHERPVGSREEQQRHAEHQKKIDAVNTRIAATKKSAEERLRVELRKQASACFAAALDLHRRNIGAGELKSLMAGAETKPGTRVIEAEHYDRGNAKKELTGYGEKIGVIYNAGTLPNVAAYDVTLAKAGAYQIELRFAAAESRPVELLVNGVMVKSGAAAAATGSWFPDTQRWSVEGVFRLLAGKNTIELRREGPFPHFDKLALIPQALPEGVSAITPTTPEQLAAERGLSGAILRLWIEFVETTWSTPSLSIAELVRGVGQTMRLPADAEKFYAPDDAAKLKALGDEVAALRKAAPPLSEAMAVTEGKPSDLRVHLRGNHLTLGQEVKRRFPGAIGGNQQKLIGTTSTGRRELAEWMTSATNPLFARVIVNRVWHWHFGTGLVRSTDNFGLLGDKPTHPDLLDWLARRFITAGYSLKTLHRLIMTSAVYQQSTGTGFPRRRLEAESLRDALLMLGGTLDRTMGGSLMQGNNRAYVPGYPNGIYDKYDFPRRSVYLPVIRSMGYDVLQAFDFPDPSTGSGERASTTVAPQALFMLNGKLMAEASHRFATRLLALPGDDAQRVRSAHEIAYGRPATPMEVERALAFVRRIEPRVKRDGAWRSLARALLSANEFAFVD